MHAFYQSRLAFVSFAAFYCCGCNFAATPPPIVIGHVSDNSRPDKAGQHAELGIRLALSELNKDNALTESFNGRAVQVRHTDTSGNLDSFSAQAARLDSVNRAIVLLGGMSGRETAGMALAKTPIVAFHGGSGGTLHLGISPKAQGEALAKACAELKPPSRVFIIQDSRITESGIVVDVFSTTLAHAVTEKKIVLDSLTTRFDEKVDWQRINDRLREHAPGMVVFAGEASDLNQWHADLRKNSVAPLTIIFAGSDGDKLRFDLGMEHGTRLIFASAFHRDADNDKTRAFVKAYSEAFNETPTAHSAIAYDALRITVEAMKRTVPITSPERLREELTKAGEFDGVSGPIYFSKSGQVARPVFVLASQGNRVSLLRIETPAKPAEK